MVTHGYSDARDFFAHGNRILRRKVLLLAYVRLLVILFSHDVFKEGLPFVCISSVRESSNIPSHVLSDTASDGKTLTLSCVERVIFTSLSLGGIGIEGTGLVPSHALLLRPCAWEAKTWCRNDTVSRQETWPTACIVTAVVMVCH
jgi:hypothetical protein